MIVHLNLTVGFKVIGHQHDRNGNVAEFVDLKEKGNGDSKLKFHCPAVTINGLTGMPNTPEAVFEAI